MAARAPGTDDADGFWDLLVGMVPRLRRYAFALAGASDADDLVQQTLLRAIDSRLSWQPGSRLDAWLYRILRNLFIDRIRARKVRNEAPEPFDPDLLRGGDAEPEVEAQLMLRAVAASVRRLPLEQREVLLLVAVEGLSYRAAAEALDLPLGTVQSRLSRARQALQADLGELHRQQHGKAP